MVKTELILALVEALVSDSISKLPVIQGERGERGLRGLPGLDGNVFNLEDHREELESFISSKIPTEISLTQEQLSSLKGKDGKDFSLDDCREEIFSLILQNIPKEIELSSDQIAMLQGPKGRDGVAGKDFSFEENEEKISSLLLDHIEKIKSGLKLSFSDLTEDEKESLRGPSGSRGQRGKPGRDFDIEEAKPIISDNVKKFISEITEDLKLKFSDLSEEDKDSLKLKFSDLSESDKFSLKGPRGQRGKQGISGDRGEQGPQGKTGLIGPRGFPGTNGLNGLNGVSGTDGRDGKDAPAVTDVVLKEEKNSFKLVFKYSDGSEIETDSIELPKPKEYHNYYSSMGGSSESSGTTNTILNGVIAPDNSIGSDGDFYVDTVTYLFYGPKTSGVWSSSISIRGPAGANGTNGSNFLSGSGAPSGGLGVDGDTYLDVDTGDTYLKSGGSWSLTGNVSSGGSSSIVVEDEYTEKTSSVMGFNFIGDTVTAVPRTSAPPMATWVTLSEVTSLSSYGIDPNFIDVYVSDPSVLKSVSCDPSVVVGAFVRMNNLGVAVNALADTYSNSNVIGVAISKVTSSICDIRISGVTEAIFSGLDTSLDYFLSASNPGELTDIVPSSSGQVALKLGQAFSSTRFLFSKGERVERI